MRLKVTVDGNGGYRWTMVTSGGKGHGEGRAVARGARRYPDAAACDDAARRLLSVDPSGMRPMQRPDGRWVWVVDGRDGQPLAESIDTFDSAAACGYALHDIRQALAADLRQRGPAG